MSEWIQFINGPLGGQMQEVVEPQENYFAVQEPDPFQSFKHSVSFVPPTDLLAERVVYYRISDTRKPIKYMTNTFDRAQEVINFVRALGFTLDAGQERMMRYWFGPAIVGDTQDDSVQP